MGVKGWAKEVEKLMQRKKTCRERGGKKINFRNIERKHHRRAVIAKKKKRTQIHAVAKGARMMKENCKRWRWLEFQVGKKRSDAHALFGAWTVR